MLSDKYILNEHYESWALLRDEDRNSMLPNMAAGKIHRFNLKACRFLSGTL